MELHLSQNSDADALLSKSPFALVVGMVLDQQVPLEWAFASPLELQRRLGKTLDAKHIAQMDPEALAAAFSARPALHRYPGSMAARVQELAKLVVERYRGRTEDIWTGTTSGDELFRRVKELPGFGEQKAKIFVALLGKQLAVRPQGWDAVSTPFSEPGSFRSVADITDVESLNNVRAFKQAMKAANKAKTQPDKAGASTTKARRTKKTTAGKR
ncbi:MAG TPA: HhH-GPD-type base excision DNA repair protein [Acidimicrobiales bacterium]